MGKRILLIQGHPDAHMHHLGHALEDAYFHGAVAAGHIVERVRVADLDFPLLRSASEWQQGLLPESLVKPQMLIGWCEHMVLFFPLWLGDMPAVLKGFLEQVARPGFAFMGQDAHPFAQKGLSGRSARVVVTMGMPATIYRWYFRAHSVHALERNIFGFAGIAPVHETLIGNAGTMKTTVAGKWLARMKRLGFAGQ